MAVNVEHLRSIARRGGAAMKAKAAADPEYYRHVGALGGRAGRGKPKPRKRSLVAAPIIATNLITRTLDEILAALDEPV